MKLVDPSFPLPILFGFLLWIVSLSAFVFFLLVLFFYFSRVKSRRIFSSIATDQIHFTQFEQWKRSSSREEKSFYLNPPETKPSSSVRLHLPLPLPVDHPSTSNHRSIISHLNSLQQQQGISSLRHHQHNHDDNEADLHLSIESLFSKDSLLE